MSHQHKWWIENRVIYNEYNGNVSSEDLKTMSLVIAEYLNVSDAPLVHLLINYTHMGTFPKNINVLKDSVFAMLEHPKMGWLITYGKDEKIISFISTVITQMFGTRVRSKNSITGENHVY